MEENGAVVVSNTHDKKKNEYKITVGQTVGKSTLEELGIYGAIILKFILNKLYM
jgi:cadmium resistance protein CadD (predicted permease)